MSVQGRKLSHAGEVSSNPQPHQKRGGRKLSELVGQSHLARQLSRSFNLQAPMGACSFSGPSDRTSGRLLRQPHLRRTSVIPTEPGETSKAAIQLRAVKISDAYIMR
jgi:hypothetical protein